MNLTSILVYIDTTPACDIRMDLAFRLARPCDAYVTGAGLEEAVVGPGAASTDCSDKSRSPASGRPLSGCPYPT